MGSAIRPVRQIRTARMQLARTARSSAYVAIRTASGLLARCVGQRPKTTARSRPNRSAPPGLTQRRGGGTGCRCWITRRSRAPNRRTPSPPTPTARPRAGSLGTPPRAPPRRRRSPTPKGSGEARGSRPHRSSTPVGVVADATATGAGVRPRRRRRDEMRDEPGDAPTCSGQHVRHLGHLGEDQRSGHRRVLPAPRAPPP